MICFNSDVYKCALGLKLTAEGSSKVEEKM